MNIRTPEQRHNEYLRSREKCIARAKKWVDSNPDKRTLILKRWNAKAGDYKRKWAQKKNFGVTIELVECYLCANDNKLVVHHRDGNNGKMGNSLNNDPNNLVVLCRSCHATIHTHGKIKVLV